jgi:serine/threonine-protein kinase RsbW
VTDTVTVSFSADTRNVALARTVAAAVAARADFPLDRLEDLRLAVDEAVTQVIACASSEVTCIFTEGEHAIEVVVHALTTVTEPVSVTSFGWTVLTALVDSVSSSVADGRLTISLRASSGLVDV